VNSTVCGMSSTDRSMYISWGGGYQLRNVWHLTHDTMRAAVDSHSDDRPFFFASFLPYKSLQVDLPGDDGLRWRGVAS
jgi:hypothetical protein